MATTTTTAVPTATTAASSTADDFVNNFLSDLAPLLALFGDQATKQFLSLCTGWADNIILAMGPLGILTIIVSAIRLSNLKWLKALIGRARESFASAEVEVLSSTSKDVCERYNGNEIVRKEGRTDTKELIYSQWTEKEDADNATGRKAIDRKDQGLVFDIKEAYEKGVIHVTDDSSQRMSWSRLIPRYQKGDTTELDDECTIATSPAPKSALKVLNRLDESAPNLTLHLPNALVPPLELWIFAALALAVQAAVLVLSAITVYQWHTQKAGNTVNGYAYPCFLVGTVSLSAGLLICAHVIEGSDESINFKLANPETGAYKIIRIQYEEELESWVISNTLGDPVLRTLTSDNVQQKPIIAIGSFLAIAGYLAQYLGLRGLPWSTTIMQLAATIIMAAVRAYVRRGLANTPDTIERPPRNRELSWLARKIYNSPNLQLQTVSGSFLDSSIPVDAITRDDTKCLGKILLSSQKVHRDLDYQIFSFAPNHVVAGLIRTHERLQKLTTWKYPNEILVDQLAAAMIAVTRTLIDEDRKGRSVLNLQRDSVVLASPDSFASPGVALGLPDVLFCTCGEKNCVDKPRLSTFRTHLRFGPSDTNDLKSRLGAILDFWTQSDRYDAKAGSTNGKECEQGMSPRSRPGSQHTLRILGSVVPDSQWTLKRLNLLKTYMPHGSFIHVQLSDGLHPYKWVLSARDDSPGSLGLHSPAITYGLMFSSLLRSVGTSASSQASANQLKFIEYPDLAVNTLNDWDRECAHDIFSAFMLGVADKIIYLGRTQRSVPKFETLGNSRGSFPFIGYPLIEKLATAVKASGLVHHIEESYTLLVPSLGAYDLLPEADREKGMEEREVEEQEWDRLFPLTSNRSRRRRIFNHYGSRTNNGFDLSRCGWVIEQWLQVLYSLSDKEKFEKVLDFIFKPDESSSTSDKDITSVYNKTRASMYLLQTLALDTGKAASDQLLEESRTVREELDRAFERMGPRIALVTEEELRSLYPSLRSEIEKIAKGEKGI